MLNEQYYFDQYEEREADLLECIEDLKRENEFLRRRIQQLGDEA
jgi:hypothetical protein